MAASYTVRETPLRGETVWSVEDGDLVRRRAGQETRRPLTALTRMTLRRRLNRYGPDVALAELRFGRTAFAFSSQGWRGLGQPEDRSAAFSAFVRALAAHAADHAPSARFQVAGQAAAWSQGGLYWIAALLGAALLTMVVMALSARQLALGLDLGARLLFVLILLLAAAPWLPGGGARRFDPRNLPSDLTP